MYYLRINEDNSFGFVVEGIHDILDTDIKITDEEYNDYFKNNNGKNYRVKNPTGTKLLDIIEEYTKETVIKKSPIELLIEENNILRQQQFEQDEMIIENAFTIANMELGGLY